MKDEQHSTGLHAWMTAKPGRRPLVAAVLFVVGMTVFFAAWFGLALLFGDRQDGGALALNTVLVGFCAVVLLPVLHRGMLRGFWHHAREGEPGARPVHFNWAPTWHRRTPMCVGHGRYGCAMPRFTCWAWHLSCLCSCRWTTSAPSVAGSAASA